MAHFLRPVLIGLLGLWGLLPGQALARDYITLLTTTTTENSGLFAAILPEFSEASGFAVRLVASGTGQAIDAARRCDGDVLLVHDTEAELEFVAAGYAAARLDVMFNDFVVLGPLKDDAKIMSSPDASSAFRKIFQSESRFISRGDRSGTHKAELRLWDAAGLDPRGASGTWYLQTGAGMGATLNVAAEKRGYTLSDRGTWATFKNKGTLKIVLEHDAGLVNQYGIMLVAAEKCPGTKAEAGKELIDWLTGPSGQAAIGAFAPHGQALFTPNASK